MFLIGDAGEPFIEKSSQIKVLSDLVREAGENSSVIFLGDNIYPRGMPDEDNKHREVAEQIITSQISFLKEYQGNTFIIPGNHDWEKGTKDGMYQNMRQEEFIEDYLDSANVYLPDGSCPGPEEIHINEEITLIIVDTQWILHPWDKPRKDDGCQVQSSAELIDLLEDIIERNAHKKIIFASHHPMVTYGIHGGVTTIKDHIFPLTAASHGLYIPLPVIGSIYPFYRKYIGSLQDLANPRYKSVSKALFEIFEAHPNLIQVAGHEHNLQYSLRKGIHYVVSGAGSKHTPVKKKGFAQFVKDTIGFARLDFYKSGSVELTFIQADAKEIWKKEIFNEPYVEPEEISEIDFHDILEDSVVITAASDEFVRSSSDYWLVGENYRNVWAAKVDVPVFDIGSEKGGLKIIQRGGGMQTKSLRLENKDGEQYVLRSVRKFTEKVVPEPLRETVAGDLIQDQISSSHPYGAFAVKYLASEAGIYHTNPKLVYIPDDPRFGNYRSDFAGTISLFEERPAGDRSDIESFGESKKILNTADVLKQLYKDNDNNVDQPWVLKSRIFDLFIGDWDRHDDQWRWASFNKKGPGKMFRPIPRDRDQAFFKSEGFIMSIVKRKWAMPKFQGFDYDLKNPAGFMFNARYFDRDFLSELDEEDWHEGVKLIQSKMTDEVIEKAIKSWSPEVYELSGEEVISKLKARREKLDVWAMDYYRFLSKNVNVRGTNKKEFFRVERLDDGMTRVRVYKMTDKDKTKDKIYDRTFSAEVTKEIRLYGLKGDDLFEVKGKVKKGIKIRIIGGGGKDEIEDKSKVSGLSKKTIVYDTRKTKLDLGKESRDRISNKKSVNIYNRKDFKYDVLAPLAVFNYNVDDGVFLGGGFIYTRNGFRKEPFKSRHFLLGSLALGTFSWDFKYRGTFTDVISDLDLKINLLAQAPNYVTNYFGPGNDTFNNQQANEFFNVDDAIDYYRVRFEHYSAELLLEKNLGTKANVSFGTHWQAFETRQNYEGESRFILDYSQAIGDLSIFDWKTYQGLVFKMDVDSRDHKSNPKQGVLWNLDLRGYTGLNNASNRFTRMQSDVSFYYTIRIPSSLTIATRVGGGFNRGKYEYYQGQFLSGPVHLRGFRKTRFVGDEAAFGNAELRYGFANIRNRVIPTRVGVNAFYDIGRVWFENETSNTWHRGYGGGIWFAPLDAAVFAIELGSSKEETRLYFRMGFMF